METSPTILPCAYGRFVLVEHLGAGGCAHVYRALAPDGRTVVIKRPRPELAAEPALATAFTGEAQLYQEARQENLVSLLGAERDESGQLFLVLEYIDGWDLRLLLRAARRSGRRLPTWFALSVGLDVLGALVSLEGLRGPEGAPRRVVHRDLTPANVLLGKDGLGRLLDLGLAFDSGRASDPFEGRVPGTLAYSAPEQLALGPLDIRADLFSLGAMLFEMLTARAPFRAPTPEQVVEQIVSPARVPPSHYRADLPPALDACVLSALDFDPARRPPTARAMRGVLLDLLTAVRGAGGPDRRALAELAADLARTEASTSAAGGPASDPGAPPNSASGWVLDLPITPPVPEDSEPPSAPQDESSDGTYAIINPRLLAAQKERAPETGDLLRKNLLTTIPMPGRPAEVETRDLIRGRPQSVGSRFFLRGAGRGIRGPLHLEEAFEELAGQAARDPSLAISGDGQTWVPAPAAVLAIAGDDHFDEPPEVAPRFQGSLLEKSALSVLANLGTIRATGRVVFTAHFPEGVERVQVDLEGGRPVHAASERSAAELPLQLLRQRLVEKDALEAALIQVFASLRPLAAVLAETVRLDLAAERGRLMASRLEAPLSWGAGDFAFYEISPRAQRPFAASVFMLFTRLLHRALSRERLLSALGGALEAEFATSPRTRVVLEELGLSKVQRAAAEDLLRGPTLAEAVARSDQGEKFALVLAYLFTELGLLVPMLEVTR